MPDIVIVKRFSDSINERSIFFFFAKSTTFFTLKVKYITTIKYVVIYFRNKIKFCYFAL